MPDWMFPASSRASWLNLQNDILNFLMRSATNRKRCDTVSWDILPKIGGTHLVAFPSGDDILNANSAKKDIGYCKFNDLLPRFKGSKATSFTV